MRQRPPFPWFTDGTVPLVVAGAGVMGFHWPYFAGPILIALGLLIFVVRTAFWLRSAMPAGNTPRGLILTSDAGKWLYAKAPERIRDGMRGTPWESIEQAGDAFVRAACGETKVCPLFVVREPGLPPEKVDPLTVQFTVFEQIFGSDRKPPWQTFVRRRDLKRILRYYVDHG